MEPTRNTLEPPLTYESAATHASKEVPVFSPNTTAEQVRRSMEGRRYACADLIIACEGETFLGAATIEDLIAAAPGDTLARFMNASAPKVAPGLDQEVAAWQAVRNRMATLPVVDAEGRFVGVIPPDRLLTVLLLEHEEDLSVLGGFTKSAAEAKTTSEEPVGRRFRHRLPWLLIGLAGALLAADIVGRFEAELQNLVMIAFFMPGIVYLADAVGTQTETIIVRGLSVGVPLRAMLPREIVAGLTIGLALAVVAYPLVWSRWGAPELALGVALSVFATCSTATLAAMALPWLLDSLGLDPAFGSGPLATVVQDLLSILIYFAITTAIVQ